VKVVNARRLQSFQSNSGRMQDPSKNADSIVSNGQGGVR
jgi:hypothetical protein